MSFTVAQLEAQKVTTMKALGSGQITMEGYKLWMTNQDQLIAEARAREAAQQQQKPSSSTPVAPPSASAQQSNTVTSTVQSAPTVIVANPFGLSSGRVSVSEAELRASVAPPPPSTASKVKEFFLGASPDPSAIVVSSQKAIGGGTSTTSSSSFVLPSGKNIPKTPYQAARDEGINIVETDRADPKPLANTLLLTVAAPVAYLAPIPSIIGAGISVGGSQLIKTGTQAYRGEDLEWLSPSEVFYAGTTGVIFGGSNQLLSKGLSGVANPWLREGARAGVNAALGGFTSGMVETGMTGETSLKTVATGAAIAGGVSLGISGIQAAKPYLLTYKAKVHEIKVQVTHDQPFERFNPSTGKVEFITVETGVISEVGLFKIPAQKSIFGGMRTDVPTPVKGLSRTIFTQTENPSTLGLLFNAKSAPIPKNAVIPYTTGSFQAGFQPTTPLSTGATIRTMQALGYSSAELSLVSDLRSLAAPVQNVKVNPAQAKLPAETLTFNTAGMTQFKDLVKRTPQATLFGSAVLQPQLQKTASYTVADAAKGNKVEVSDRLPMDIDIDFSGSPAEADRFVEQILQIGKETGNQLSVDPAQPYQILGVHRETGNPAHAFDIKVSGVDSDLSAQSNNPLAWGFEQSKPSTKIEGLPVQRLDEQINRLAFGSTLRFQPDRTLGPTSHRRAKDTLRTLHALETAYATKGVDVTVDPRFTRTMEYFGISREDYVNAPKEVKYVLENFTPAGRTSDQALDMLLGYETSGSGGGNTRGDGGVSVGVGRRSGYGGAGSVGSDRYSRSLLAAALGYPSAGSGRRGSGSGSSGSRGSSGRGGSGSGSGSPSPVDVLELPSASRTSVFDIPGGSSVFDIPPPPSPYPSPSPSPSPYGYPDGSPDQSPYNVPYILGTSRLFSGGNPGSMFDRRDSDSRRNTRKSKGGRQERHAPVADVDVVLKRALKGLI